MFLADIKDHQSFVTDVNITVECDEKIHFENVQNPTFWHNTTYGRVVFNARPGKYTVRFHASDSHNNVIVKSALLRASYVDHRIDTPERLSPI
jgi:hypothetical protein